VLNNVPATDLSLLQQDRLRQFVRDLGGGLVISGGDHAFAAGGYPGTVLEGLSPLASTPPRPTTHWMLLADASGSMNEPIGGATRWQFAAPAMVRALPHLPPDDVASVGGFSQDLTWWSANRSVRDTIPLPLPPPGMRPHGPTNLRPALDRIAAEAEPGIPRQLLVLTDADTDLGDPLPLISALKQKDIHVSLLAIGEGRALSALRQVVDATGGHYLREDETAKWSQAVEELTRQSSPRFLGDRPLALRFLGDLASMPKRDVSPWNQTWPKQGSTPLAEGTTDTGDRLTPAERWNLGEGAVVAAAFATDAGLVDRLAGLVAHRPRDPRLQISWETGPRLLVKIDAVDGQTYLNGLTPALELINPATSQTDVHPIPQTGPGAYSLSLPAPRSPTIAAIRASGQIAERIAVAGRYAPEFDAIGTDRELMSTLADRTGGSVIDPQSTQPIPFHWPSREISLTPWLASCGGLLIAFGLVWWRVK
jgi:hypothetical protein